MWRSTLSPLGIRTDEQQNAGATVGCVSFSYGWSKYALMRDVLPTPLEPTNIILRGRRLFSVMQCDEQMLLN